MGPAPSAPRPHKPRHRAPPSAGPGTLDRPVALDFPCGARVDVPAPLVRRLRAVARILEGSEEERDPTAGPVVLPLGRGAATPRAVAYLALPAPAPPLSALPWDLLSEVADAARYLEHTEAYEGTHAEAAARLCGLDARAMRAVAAPMAEGEGRPRPR